MTAGIEGRHIYTPPETYTHEAMIEDSAESTITKFKRDISPADRVLDLGSKTAAKVDDVAGTVVAVDINRGALSRSDVDAEFVAADGTRLPFETNSFDYIHCDQVLEHVPDTGGLVAEAARVLKPDGLMYVDFPNRLALRQPHEPIPGYYSFLPRPLGVALAGRLLDEKWAEYYRRALFPISPIAARWQFHRHFDAVQYPMRLDPRPRADSVRKQELIWWANTVAKLPPLKWVGELLWPACNYILGEPNPAWSE